MTRGNIGRPGLTALISCSLLGSSVARAQDEPAAGDVAAMPGTPAEIAQPPTAAPEQAPPEPPAQPPALPAQAQVQPAQPQDGAPSAAQPVNAGQWVYTSEYGWVWMPYGAQYTYEGTQSDSTPYSYVYYPSYGWTWLAAPWVWGWGSYPWFGVAGPWRFGWYRGLYHAGYGWGRYRGGYAGAHSGYGGAHVGAVRGSVGGGFHAGVGGFRGAGSSGRAGGSSGHGGGGAGRGGHR
jgi:hypothetical protein